MSIKRIGLGGAVLALLPLLSVLVLEVAAQPFVWIAAGWLAGLVWLTLRARNSTIKSVWFNFGVLVFLLGILEIHSFYYLRSKNTTRFEGGYTQGYFIADELLGYAPEGGRTVTSRKIANGQPLYDVTYTIDENGLRRSAASAPTDPHRCVLFFGGSYTFGEGVEDHETMPYIVGELTGSRVFNFGFHGYGAHQMLSAIEHGRVDRALECETLIVVYQALVTHASRSAGYSSWDHHGPRYTLSDEGGVRFRGNFDDEPRPLRSRLERSNLFRRHFGIDRHKTNERDVRLFLEIVAAAERQLTRAHPSVEFHVILWDPERVRSGKAHRRAAFEGIRDGLRERSIDLHLISEILPDLAQNESDYALLDGHPNPRAHREIARFVAKNLVP